MLQPVYSKNKSIQKITSIPPKLSTNENIIYDDVYGIWTDQDQNLVSAEVFRLLDMEEEVIDNTKFRYGEIPQKGLGTVELNIPPRELMRETPRF